MVISNQNQLSFFDICGDEIFNSKPNQIRNEKLLRKWQLKVAIDLNEIDVTNPKHLATLNASGMSFGTIERIWGLPHTSAHATLARRALRTSKFSLLRAIADDYLNNPKVSEPDKQKIREWIAANTEALKNADGRFFSMRQENDLLRREQSPKFKGDFWGYSDDDEEDDMFWESGDLDWDFD